MSGMFGSWAASMAAVTLLGAVMLALTPKGRVRQVQSLLCGAALILAVMAPVVDFDSRSYALALSRYRELAAAAAAEAEEESDRLARSFIEQECAAYILDKAQVLGVETGTVTVTVRWGGDCWVPDAVQIEKEIPAELSRCISADLGIPEERQMCG